MASLKDLIVTGPSQFIGAATVSGNPSTALMIAPKQYVDALSPASASISNTGLISFLNANNATLFTLQLPLYDGGVS